MKNENSMKMYSSLLQMLSLLDMEKPINVDLTRFRWSAVNSQKHHNPGIKTKTSKLPTVNSSLSALSSVTSSQLLLHNTTIFYLLLPPFLFSQALIYVRNRPRFLPFICQLSLPLLANYFLSVGTTGFKRQRPLDSVNMLSAMRWLGYVTGKKKIQLNQIEQNQALTNNAKLNRKGFHTISILYTACPVTWLHVGINPKCSVTWAIATKQLSCSEDYRGSRSGWWANAAFPTGNFCHCIMVSRKKMLFSI